MVEPADQVQVIVGSYTEPHRTGERRALGISGGWTALGDALDLHLDLVATSRNPTYVIVSSDGGTLYAVNEVAAFDDHDGGGVTAYRRDMATGALEFLNSRPSDGTFPCHLAFSPDERFVIVVNYGSGTGTVLPRYEDGQLGPATCNFEPLAAAGVGRQAQVSHLHMACPDPISGCILVVDLGLDAVLTYDMTATGQLTERADRRIMAIGSGPRHVAFHPRGAYLFILGELDNTILVLRRHAEHFAALGGISTLPGVFNGTSYASAIRVSPTGRHIMVANRGHDSVAMFAFDDETGVLTPCHIEPSRGRTPRDICLAPGGQYLAVANQGSDNLAIFVVDEESSRMSFLRTLPVASPACITFVARDGAASAPRDAGSPAHVQLPRNH
jgi:6-phosphogluconolactonase